jgi:hypothetical protein
MRAGAERSPLGARPQRWLLNAPRPSSLKLVTRVPYERALLEDKVAAREPGIRAKAGCAHQRHRIDPFALGHARVLASRHQELAGERVTSSCGRPTRPCGAAPPRPSSSDRSTKKACMTVGRKPPSPSPCALNVALPPTHRCRYNSTVKSSKSAGETPQQQQFMEKLDVDEECRHPGAKLISSKVPTPSSTQNRGFDRHRTLATRARQRAARGAIANERRSGLPRAPTRGRPPIPAKRARGFKTATSSRPRSRSSRRSAWTAKPQNAALRPSHIGTTRIPEQAKLRAHSAKRSFRCRFRAAEHAPPGSRRNSPETPVRADKSPCSSTALSHARPMART